MQCTAVRCVDVVAIDRTSTDKANYQSKEQECE